MLDEITVLGITLVCSCIYALAVHWLRNQDPDHGLTPVLVAVGNSIIIAGVFLTHGIEIAGWLLALNFIAGLPMAASYYLWRVSDKKHRKQHREF